MKDKNHTEIMYTLENIAKTGEGINKRLDTLNGSVAKHEQRLAAQDVLNAQMTITQAQIVNELKTLKENDTTKNDWVLKTQGSIGTFKWLFGFLGIGTLITLLKVLGVIGTTVQPLIK